MKTYAIAGGSAAGAAAARAIRARDPKGRILMICGDPCFYTRCQLHRVAAGEKGPTQIPFVPSDFAKTFNVELKRSVLVDSVDADNRRLLLSDGASEAYDSLLVATGASSGIPPLEGFAGPNVFKFRDLSDALAVRDAIMRGAKRVAVVGAGLAGTELAAELAGRGLDVSLVELESRPLPLQLEEESGALCVELLKKGGVKLQCGRKIAGLERDERNNPALLRFEDGEALPCDIVVCAAGVRPNAGLLANNGLSFKRGIVVDARCRTALDDVYAAGDVAESLDVVTGVVGPTPIWPAAVRQGFAAGANMAGDSVEVERNTAFRTAFSLLGTSFVSLGPVKRPKESWRKFVCRSTDAAGRKSLKIFFVEGDVLKAAIVCGDIASSGVYADAIVNKRPLPSNGEDERKTLDSLRSMIFGAGPFEL